MLSQTNNGIDIGTNFLGKNHFLTKETGLGQLVSIISSNAIVLAGLVLVILFIGGGFMMISGAGKDNPEQAAKGKQAVSAAVVGFLIVFAAYWIVQLIGKITGINLLGN